ncbi:hypothetical protein [Bacillus bingmayongensis]|uniref:Uncharacterized protein n=1 Tax=Bacillus bingmayongensis TaxID=1150157 RepID=A0ABU5K1G5_9BACI|nr:hypothetical protein [Bacillus bingmayongensis]MBY0595306.1 hypothetical protein [Bacillus bingmayongensis]MDZ5609529.1 hypothetical protein [Bacillus pseudomycoides]
MNPLELAINTVLGQVVRVLDWNIDKYSHGKIYMDLGKYDMRDLSIVLQEGHYDTENGKLQVENETRVFSFCVECDKREDGALILSYLNKDNVVTGKYIEAKTINSLYRKIMKINGRKGYLISTNHKDYFLIKE